MLFVHQQQNMFLKNNKRTAFQGSNNKDVISICVNIYEEMEY